MKFLGKLFGGLKLDVNKIVDKCVTSKGEAMELKNTLQSILAEAEGNAQEQVTRRWEADAKAGWLPANIRPLTLAFLTMIFVIISFIEGGVIDFQVKDTWIDLLQLTLITVIGAYFGGRSIEKVKK